MELVDRPSNAFLGSAGFIHLIYWGIAKLVKAPDFDSGIRGFESLYPCQICLSDEIGRRIGLKIRRHKAYGFDSRLRHQITSPSGETGRHSSFRSCRIA